MCDCNSATLLAAELEWHCARDVPSRCVPCISPSNCAAGSSTAGSAAPSKHVLAAMAGRAHARSIAKRNEGAPVTAIAEACWHGDSMLLGTNTLLTLAPHVSERFENVITLLTFANAHCIETSEGLVLIDCGTKQVAPKIHATVRAFSDAPLHTCIYTHGHNDHTALLHSGFLEEARPAGGAPLHIVAQHAIVQRFDRYKKTAAYNSNVNQRQWQHPSYIFPTDFAYPTQTYIDELHLDIGGESFELYHAMV